MAVHHAAVVAGTPDAMAIADVCARAEVEILRYPIPLVAQKAGQTMAVVTLGECLQTYGRDTLVTALPVRHADREHGPLRPASSAPS